LEKADRARVTISDTRALCGSVCIDEALRADYPNDARWDYGIGVRNGKQGEVAVWAEVHPASSHHVRDVLNKLDWLRTWLTKEATEFKRLDCRYRWITTGAITFRGGNAQHRLIAQRGLAFPVKRLDLDRLD
jgi:hypothetical protein